MLIMINVRSCICVPIITYMESKNTFPERDSPEIRSIITKLRIDMNWTWESTK